MRLFIVLCALFSLNLVAEEQFPAWELPNTQVHQLPAQSNGRHYEVWVELPPSYGKTEKKFPVLFVSDANYAFPLIRSIRNRLGAGGQNIEDFVIVGLSYAKEDNPTDSRSLDFTPTNILANGKKRSKNLTAKAYGGAALYADYLRQQVIPFVLNNYQVDPKRKLFVGHSYGGLLGAQILLTQPDTFDTYILSSPSLWFDDKMMFKLEQQYATNHKDLKARVQLYAAEYEQIKPGSRYARRVSIVDDTLLFEKTLKSRSYPGLGIQSQIIADEDHLSVFPAMISRALLKLLPGYGPYTPG
ncbi:MAG: alpha/beta hydrolase [Gammaproteobacteria bacterium]|nr:alpha/beta hydrolase [Gammaproteobacteria bacterium]MBU2056571.1 alpha/beta hydrolase [Gammaproteobacteria bacterium]MBU2173623.1 alpha/beta hydrolase [Gammaproteobacteria bacterium]MBU2246599.1 alpha/beta hydrolase [Gammaproteobacteria bacterium]MBU2344509.1 alpha/beta hydrolase [Gammaproteobacteria bacterium]